MEKKGVLSTFKFISLTVIILVLIFSAVTTTVMNMYKNTLKVSIDGKFIGYFSSRDQFDEVYNTLVFEKQQIDPNVKIYMNSDPVFEESYIRDELFSTQNVYTNLRAELKTEYTTYSVIVDGENKMTFNSLDEANEYSSNLKDEVAKLSIEIKEDKVSELENITTRERADVIYKDIVSRNKVVVRKTTTSSSLPASKGVAAEAIEAAKGGTWPTLARVVSSHFGWRPSLGDFHTGTDLDGKTGDPIYAYKAGRVIFSGWNCGYGYLVKIDHGNGLSTYYAHCNTLNVKTGQTVAQGQVIATVGNTGRSFGDHLHFEIRINGTAVNAYPIMTAK